jgi:hypothetical protein
VVDVVSEVMVQAAATSFIHMQILAISQVSQRERKTLNRSGDSHSALAIRRSRGAFITPLLLKTAAQYFFGSIFEYRHD